MPRDTRGPQGGWMNLRLVCFFGFATGLTFMSCSSGADHGYRHPKRVVVSGCVLNSAMDRLSVRLSVNRVAFGQEEISADLDSLGNFRAEFETYIPTDVWVKYRTNFLVLVHPEDSLHITFDGSLRKRPPILKTVRFAGTSSKLNTEASQFQYLYYSDELYTDSDRKERATRQYGAEQYVSYLDTMRQKGRVLRDRFASEYAPSHAALVWADNFLEGKYYHDLSYYPRRSLSIPMRHFFTFLR